MCVLFPLNEFILLLSVFVFLCAICMIVIIKYKTEYKIILRVHQLLLAISHKCMYIFCIKKDCLRFNNILFIDLAVCYKRVLINILFFYRNLQSHNAEELSRLSVVENTHCRFAPNSLKMSFVANSFSSLYRHGALLSARKVGLLWNAPTPSYFSVQFSS